ncbi:MULTISPECIES: AMP-binding protein [Actinosynnema]|uniref:AMP-binding protein n=1 Tax=Actinosynnema TaxID=40566 RepID=UPI0020A25A63|nr:AMP-binding protein [Actinosynnema pretiosum]MCP2092864.1 AMP-binding enzyme C-terminal domain-containing protein [Actinosynnema pretiosum]
MGTYSAARALATLVRAGVVRPMRPDRLLGVLGAYLRWRVTLPFGYATGAARHPGRTALVDDLGALTYAEVDQRTTRLAAGLAALGVGGEHRVAVLCRNHRGFVETVVACAKLGADVVLLNSGLSPARLVGVLREQEPVALVADAEFDGALSGAPGGIIRVTAWPEDGESADDAGTDGAGTGGAGTDGAGTGSTGTRDAGGNAENSGTGNARAGHVGRTAQADQAGGSARAEHVGGPAEAGGSTRAEHVGSPAEAGRAGSGGLPGGTRDHPRTTLDDLRATSAPLPARTSRSHVVVLTSGTSGPAKGARRPEPPSLAPAAALFSRIPLRHGDVCAIPAPLFHTWGFAAFQLALVLGGTLVLRRHPTPEALAEDLRGCDALFTVPVHLQRLLEVNGPLPRPRVIASSGSALPPRVVRDCLRRTGPALHNLYGSTEVSWVTVARPDELAAHPTTAGKPPPGTALEILDERGDPVPPGETGRIFAGNDMLFDGYTHAGSKDRVRGLMPTGDLGKVVDGLLFVVGRDDEMVVSGGENVHPAAVEDVISAMPGVREAAVVGVPDERFGQRLVAHVVKDDDGPSEEAVLARVRAELARFAVPRAVVFHRELPRNATGKVLKRELGA